MAGPVRLPASLPTALTPAGGAAIPYTAAVSDALAPTYGATAADKTLQFATTSDALGPTYTATTSDANAT